MTGLEEQFDYLSGSDSILQNVFSSYAKVQAEKAWCTFEGRSYSYGWIDSSANRIANGLREEFGIRRGDAVAVCMHNRPEFFMAMFGIQRLGAVYVPCSVLYSPEELGYQLRHAEIKALFTDTELLPKVQEALGSDDLVSRVIAFGAREAEASVIEFDDFLERQRDTSPEELNSLTAEDLAMIMYTSGTTARPKGVMYSHGNITTLGHTLAKYLGWTREDVYLHHFPLYHGNGGLMGVAPAIWSGATLAMIPKFSASNFGHQLVEFGATFTAVNATHVKMILNNPVTEYDSVHAVRRMILGMTLAPEQIVDFETRFRTRLFGTYGLTETLTAMVVGEPSGLGPHAAAGRVARGYSLRVVDENEEILPAGTVGEALIFSHQRHGLTMGYFKDPVKTREAFVDGWLHTGDFVRVDEGGYVWYEGRKKDMIKRSGFNVAPAEVERVIQEIAGVSEVAVIGCPDDMREEAIVAFVVADTQMFEADVIAACTKQLAHYKVPQVVEFLEALPENFLGKVDRNELRVRALKYRVDSTNRP